MIRWGSCQDVTNPVTNPTTTPATTPKMSMDQVREVGEKLANWMAVPADSDTSSTDSIDAIFGTCQGG